MKTTAYLMCCVLPTLLGCVSVLGCVKKAPVPPKAPAAPVLERDTYADLKAIAEDGDRQPYVWELRPEFSEQPTTKKELDGIARYYRDFPKSDGALKLGILKTLGDYEYEDPAFCDWLLKSEGLSPDRDLRGYAWYYFCDKVKHKYKATEFDMKLALELSLKYPGVDVDGTTRPPDKMCVSMIRDLGALYYPNSTWWKTE